VGSKVVKQKVIVIKDFGIQLENKFLNKGRYRRFIDISRVRDVVINEV
jgi:hypothetical protein